MAGRERGERRARLRFAPVVVVVVGAGALGACGGGVVNGTFPTTIQSTTTTERPILGVVPVAPTSTTTSVVHGVVMVTTATGPAPSSTSKSG